jgi:hypothetical protein
MRLPLILSFLVLAFAGALAGCGKASEQYNYIPPPTPGGRLCSAQCEEARGYCRETCDLKQRTCVGNVQAQALHDYDQYTRDQFAYHEPTELLPRDFERPATCNNDKDVCYSDCEKGYGMCYANCGGKVDVQSSCQFLCF